MILRQAESKDLKTYKSLFPYQLLYDSAEKSQISEEEKQKIADRYFGDFNSTNPIITWHEKYIRQLFKNGSEFDFVFFAEDEITHKILGYLRIFYLSGRTYKIAEWTLFDLDDDNVKKEMLEQLLKLRLPKFREVFVYTPSKFMAKWLCKNGFEYEGNKYKRRTIRSKNKQ